MGILKNWFKNRFGVAHPPHPPAAPYQRRRVEVIGRASKPEPEQIDLDPHIQGRIESLGPGKNVFVRSQYVREETGTHETLKIVDESLLESDGADDFDPYNTGRFDRSKQWDSRSRK